jgi:V/A-type H+/Na+-transporting ATPase subunit E
MSLSTILKKIDDEADAYGQKLVEQARAEGEKLLAHNRAEAKQEAEQILRQAEIELQNLNNKQKATTLLQVRKQKLDNRQRLLDEIFVKALARIRACQPDQYKAIIKQILLSIAEEQPGQIRLAEPDQGIITKKFLDDVNTDLAKQKRALRFQLAPEAAVIGKGCIVDFGDFEMNFSFETLLTDLWENLKSEVSAQLFGDGSN